MKKILSIVLALAMLLTMAITASAEETQGYKIAILTGTASQGDEEISAAMKLAEQYPDIVITDTYPDNFSSEVETTISKLLAFAEDPAVKAIIFVQGVQGATSAFTQIREKRPDILLVTGVPAEDPAPISGAADIVLANDEIGCGYQVADLSADWGCDVIIHYSFARHMSYETIVAKHDAMKLTAETYGIEFVDRDCPDPTGDAGMSGAQAFVLEDIPKVMEEYAGKKVCFYCTNCGLQVALQQAIVKEENAYYALPCCPSPYHGFPSALGIESPADLVAGLQSTVDAINQKVAAKGLEGHFSTWSVPASIANTVGATEYAFLWMAGAAPKSDKTIMEALLSDYCQTEVKIVPYEDPESKKSFDNYWVYLQGFLTFDGK